MTRRTSRWLTARMKRRGSLRIVLVVLCCLASLSLAGPAGADQLQQCIDEGNAQGIDMPTCIENSDGTLTPVSNGGGEFGQDDGIPDGFIVLFVLVFLLGVGVTIWRVSMARKLATDAGMDPGLATGMTLLEEDGLSATYLASSLRGSAQPSAQPASPAPAAERLAQLKDLLDRGLITQAEHDERRRAIVDAL